MIKSIAEAAVYIIQDSIAITWTTWWVLKDDGYNILLETPWRTVVIWPFLVIDKSAECANNKTTSKNAVEPSFINRSLLTFLTCLSYWSVTFSSLMHSCNISTTHCQHWHLKHPGFYELFISSTYVYDWLYILCRQSFLTQTRRHKGHHYWCYLGMALLDVMEDHIMVKWWRKGFQDVLINACLYTRLRYGAWMDCFVGDDSAA